MREHIYISKFYWNPFTLLLFRIVSTYTCLQWWRLNCVASLCLFLSADVESGHVSTNSALRMLFRFMFRVMLQCLLRNLMVLQHNESLNAVSVVRGTSPHNRVAVATFILIPEKERSVMHWYLHICLKLLCFLSLFTPSLPSVHSVLCCDLPISICILVWNEHKTLLTL